MDLLFFIDPNFLKIDEKSYKNVNIYYIGYITRKDSGCVKTKSVNPLSLILSEVDRYIKEKIGNKYLIFNSAGKNKEVLKKALNSGMKLKMILRQ